LHQTISKKAEDLILEQSKGFDAAVIGPGLSENAETIQLIWDLIFKLEITVILDADGINALAKGIEVARSKEDIDFIRNYFKKKKCELLITPHPGEALRILKALKPKELEGQKLTTQYINTHKEDIAPLLAEILSSTVVLKGNNTVIADPSGRRVVDMVGGPELSVSGSGDVLAGIVGSFVGQNKNKIFESACTGVFLHSKSGSIAKNHVGERSVIASDIIRYLPEAIKEAEKEI
ncbi:MAG: NAD(P)H-hydrate dehydratase, partial [Patescibacteria group bacterium]|nr:NAD(P)H-hydrate dehydratase [Patescibacteria group bacterium]